MIERIDHFVLTVRSIDATCDFYTACLDFERVDAPGSADRAAVRPAEGHRGSGRPYLRPQGPDRPTEGSADFRAIVAVPLNDVVDRFARHHVPVELGPVDRDGALGPMRSIYFRDPDGNLIEVSEYRDPHEVTTA